MSHWSRRRSVQSGRSRPNNSLVKRSSTTDLNRSLRPSRCSTSTCPYEPGLRERAAEGEWRDIPWSRLEGHRDPEWRIFARSTADSKGQNIKFLAAISAMDAAGGEVGIIGGSSAP